MLRCLNRFSWFLVFIGFFPITYADDGLIQDNPAYMYLGTCYAMQYLKLQYCPSMIAIKMPTCISTILDEASENNQEIIKSTFKNRTKLIMPHIIKHIDKSYPQYLAQYKGNRLRTCDHYQKDMQYTMKKYLEEVRTTKNDAIVAD